MKCSICKGQIEKKAHWNEGHNAEPVNKGRCCDKCNDEIVTPQRIADVQLIREREIKLWN